MWYEVIYDTVSKIKYSKLMLAMLEREKAEVVKS